MYYVGGGCAAGGLLFRGMLRCVETYLERSCEFSFERIVVELAGSKRFEHEAGNIADAAEYGFDKMPKQRSLFEKLVDDVGYTLIPQPSR